MFIYQNAFSSNMDVNKTTDVVKIKVTGNKKTGQKVLHIPKMLSEVLDIELGDVVDIGIVKITKSGDIYGHKRDDN